MEHVERGHKEAVQKKVLYYCSSAYKLSNSGRRYYICIKGDHPKVAVIDDAPPKVVGSPFFFSVSFDHVQSCISSRRRVIS